MTATFLLTDVEGSTALWEQAPQEMSAGLARLDGVAGRVISEHGGTLAGSVGEGAPLAEFEAAETACACAIELQRAFGAEHGPTPVTVRVRIALHGGPAEETLDGASRLRDVGHGGQILVTGAVANALGDAPPGDAWLLPLRPQVFQLCAPGLREEFPPLRSDPGDLLERDAEIARLTGLVDVLIRDRSGGVALVEGPPGIGKSALMAAALAPERTAGVTVLRARGAELEAGLAFGGVRQLLSTPVLRLSEAAREVVFAGPAALARPVLGFAASPTVSPEFADPLYGLFALVSNLAERTPLVLAIDDLHWLDEESGRFVAYLASRLEGLPILLLATARPYEPGVEHRVTAALSEFALVIRPQPLSPDAVGQLIQDRPSEEVHRVTGGNPLLLLELKRTLAAAPTHADLDAIAPSSVGRSVLERVQRVSGDAVALARATALFATGARLEDAAAVADLPLGRAGAAADGLVAAQVLAAGDWLAFAHPLMRSAVYEQLGGFERRRGHATAAALLRTRGAPVNEIAAHLLSGSPEGEPENVRILVAAAAEALERAAPRAAVRYLERALVEPPQSSQERAHIGHELGRLQGKLGRAASIATLEAALRETDGAEQRIDIALDLALVRYANARWHDTIEGLDALRSSAELDAQHQLVVDALIVGAATFDRRLHGQFRAAADRIPDALTGDTEAERMALEAKAWDMHLRAEPLDETVALLRRAVDESATSRAADLGTDFGDPVLLLAALDPTRAAALAEQRLVRARELGLEASHGIGQAALAEAALARGDFREALDLYGLLLATPDLHLRTRLGALDRASQALNYQGRAEEAQRRLDELASLSEDDETVTAVAARRGELALLRRDYETAERLLRPRCRPYLTDDPYPLLSGLGWLPSYARALAGLDRTPEAVAAIRAWLPKAERLGHAGELGDLLSTLGALTPGPDGLALLQRALDLLLPSPFRWQRARAQLELGSRLRRDGERTSAREHLYAALEYAVAEHCEPIEVRATEELRIMGGRPRKVVRTGVESLTGSEQRVARLAAEGMTNKAIAQHLFLTVKTIEMHLASTYRKLDVKGRNELPGVLTGLVQGPTP